MLIAGLEDQRLHAVIYGDRGIGKTSLLHILSGAARDAGYLVLYQSCDADSDFDGMFRSVLGQIPQLYHGGIAPTATSSEVGASLADLTGATPLSPRHVTDLLAPVAGTRIIIMLDEFDRATSRSFRRSIAELIKNLSDRSARVQLVVAGVAANFMELIEHIPSIRRNVLNLELPRMDDSEVDEMLQIGSDESGLGFSDAARQRIRTIANGSPYIATLLAHHAGMRAIDEEVLEISSAHVAAAIREALRELESRIGRVVLACVARMGSIREERNISLAAGASLFSAGLFDLEQLCGGPNPLLERAVIEEMAEAGGLIVPDPVAGPGIYRFVEEGLPTYLWMRFAQALEATDSRKSGNIQTSGALLPSC